MILEQIGALEGAFSGDSSSGFTVRVRDYSQDWLCLEGLNLALGVLLLKRVTKAFGGSAPTQLIGNISFCSEQRARTRRTPPPPPPHRRRHRRRHRAASTARRRTPPPPPPPPPPPAVRTFIVFFDFDQSNLTAEAQQVVAEAVRTAMTTGMVRVVVTGHTDTVGSQAYNQGLSERRATSVQNEMVRLGLGANAIQTVGRSFTDPLVPTGPGVREPQNRRAVIDLGQ